MKGVKIILLALASISQILAQRNPHFYPGRTTIVHLFEWKWNDIADECERFLGPRGFGGVQTSPVNENAVITSPFFRPWWERYQPVSYKLETRSGTEEEFKSMVRRCNDAGVRVYVDAVINHMTGGIGEGYGTGGSYFNSDAKQYDGVPFTSEHFTPRHMCPSPSGEIENYTIIEQVRNCELSGLKDLHGGNVHVQEMHVQFLNKLISFGVAGFRLDASKHMWPEDMELVLIRLSNLRIDHGFPALARPFIFQEVIDLGGEPIKGDEYFHLGRVTEFKFSKGIGEVFHGITQLKYLVDFGIDGGWNLYPSESALSFVDNHDNQRGHGAGGETVVTFKKDRMYKMAVAFKLAWPYGVTRIMSSFNFDHPDQGPPNDNGVIKNVTLNDDGTCGNDWVCEHRWRQIFNMVEFRNVVDGTGFNDWWNDEEGNQISFCRGDKGFLVINSGSYDINRDFQTCLAPGTYCDVISGEVRPDGISCTGKYITVRTFGWANIVVSTTDLDPVVAIHANSRIA